MRVVKWFAIVAGAILLSLVMVAVAGIGSSIMQTDRQQEALDPFYTPPDPLPGGPGTMIRMEPLGVDVPGASAYRMLYVSERPDGTLAASGGMLFIPTTPAPAEGRPVVAWAHGTLGLGQSCAPSRSSDPLGDMANWLDQMMQLGWVVAATDYVGLGTPGPNLYLIAQSEVRDEVNAVRAARNVPEADAGSRYVTFGHSQGGHTSVWSGHLAPSYAPELTLLGVAGAAPALELPDIMNAQWDTAIGWMIGPDVVETWPDYYPDLDPRAVLTSTGQDTAEELSQECIKVSAIQGVVRQTLGERFFAVSPVTTPGWSQAVTEQTPPPMPSQMPVFIAQGTADELVLPWTTAALQEDWCAAGSTIAMLWMGGVTHQAAATTAGPEAVRWIADRFAGRPAPRTCDVPPPVASNVE